MRKQRKPKDLVILAGVTKQHSFEAPPLSGLFGWVTRDVSVAGLPHYQHLVEVSQSPWLSQQTSTEIFSQSAPFVLLKTKVSKNASNTGWISRCWAKRCGGREQSYKWLNGPREPHIICVCLKMGDTCATISHWVFQGNKWNMYDLRRRGDHFLKLFLQISLEITPAS
jgi:hypothetical protein